MSSHTSIAERSAPSNVCTKVSRLWSNHPRTHLVPIRCSSLTHSGLFQQRPAFSRTKQTACRKVFLRVLLIGLPESPKKQCGKTEKDVPRYVIPPDVFVEELAHAKWCRKATLRIGPTQRNSGATPRASALQQRDGLKSGGHMRGYHRPTKDGCSLEAESHMPTCCFLGVSAVRDKPQESPIWTRHGSNNNTA